jgi:predicted RNA-binding Zn ribbon-like protein
LAQQFRFDAGCPALNLLATLGHRRTAAPVERLTSPERLRDWLAANGLPVVAVDTGALRQARSLREAAYATLEALVAHRTPPAAQVATLSRWAGRPRPAPGLTVVAGGVDWAPTETTFPAVLGGLARDLAALAVQRPAALRACAAPACGMLYLDRSRGHRRRWCSMGRCGNVAKVARHRAAPAVDR